jgi:hypothetical protein
MTLLVAALSIALLAAGWVVFPILFRRWGMLDDMMAGAVMDREARRRVALAALKDIEYDYVAGKLDDSDYQEMRSRLEVEALEAMRAAEREPPAGTRSSADHDCGFANPAGSRFCAGCGQPLA